MQFTLHLLPLLQLLLSSATTSAVITSVDSSNRTGELPSTESPDQGSGDMLQPYPTTVETETDDPTTTATINTPESSPPNESTFFEEIHTTTEQYAATSDLSSATVGMPFTAESIGTTEESIEDLQTTSKYGLAIQVITKSITAGSSSESPSTAEASSTTEMYQTATPVVSSTFTELEPASTNESPTITDSQMTVKLSPTTAFFTVTTASKSQLVSTKQSPTTDQFQSSAEYSEFVSVTVSPSLTGSRSASESLTIATFETSTKSEPLSTEEYPNVVETIAKYSATTQLSTVIINSKSNILFTEEPSAYDQVQFATTPAVFSMTTKPFPSSEYPPAADMFQTTTKDSTATDFSAFIQPFFTQNPSTADKFRTTAEHTATTDHITVSMASNIHQSEPPETKAAYSVFTAVNRASLSPSVQHFSMTKPWPSKGSITITTLLQSLSAERSLTLTDHQTSAMELRFSTTSYNSYLSPIKPTTVKHVSSSASVYSSTIESKPTSVLKPQNVTQLELTATTEFPISTPFPTASKSNTDLESDTVANNSPSSRKIQPTSTHAKTSIHSTTLSSMNSVTSRVMYPISSKSEPSTSVETLHVLATESSSVPPIQSPTILDFPTISKSSSATSTSDVFTPSVPQAIAHPSLATTTPTSSNSLVPSTFMELSGHEAITKSTPTMFSAVSTTRPQTSLESLQHQSITELPFSTKTEFSTVAKFPIPRNYHTTTTNYHSIFGESSTTAESPIPITRKTPPAAQYPEYTTNYLSLDLQLMTTTKALHVSSSLTISELPIATKSLTTAHPYSLSSLLPSIQTSTEYPITSSQTVSEFLGASIDPASEYMRSSLPTLSPTAVKSDPVTNYAASTETQTKSTIKAATVTLSYYATVSPIGTTAESQPQSVNESPKITVNQSQLHSRTTIQFLPLLISPTLVSTTMTSLQSNVKSTSTATSPVDSNISVTNMGAFSDVMPVESIHITELSEVPPTTKSPNTVSPITSDQPLNIPASTLSTITTSATVIGTTSLNALVLTTEAAPMTIMGSAPTEVSLSTTTIHSFPVGLESTPAAGSVSLSENPSATESLAITESYPIQTQMTETSSISESMIDATVTALPSVITPTQSMLSTNESPKTSVISQRLEMTATSTGTESQIMAVTPSDSVTESLTTPTPLKSTNVSEFGATTKYLLITQSLTTRESLATTESHPIASQMAKISTTSVIYQSLRGTSTVASPSVTVVPDASATISPVPPMQSTTDTPANVFLSTSINLPTTEAMEILTISHFSTATAVKSDTETRITNSSAMEATITTTESHILTPSPTMGLPDTMESIVTATESLTNVTITKIISTQSSFIPSTIDTEYRDATTIIREPITGSLILSTAIKPLTMETALTVTELQRPTPTPFTSPNGVETTVGSTLSTTESQIMVDTTMIVPSATNIKSGRTSTPAAKVSAATSNNNVISAIGSSTMSDSLVATKSHPIVPEMTKVSSTFMAYPPSGSIFIALSPSMTVFPRQSLTSMQPKPSATDNPPNNTVLSTTLNVASMESMNLKETSATSLLSIMARGDETNTVALETTIMTKSISTTESRNRIITPSVTLDMRPTVISSPPIGKANPSTSDSTLFPTIMPTSLAFEATITENSSTVASPSFTESERTVEPPRATVTTQVLLLSITELPASDSMLPNTTTFTDIFTSPAMEDKISAITITAMESFTVTPSRTMSVSMQTLLTSPPKITKSPSLGTASLTTKISPTATQISPRPTATLLTVSNVVESVVGSTINTNTESHVIAEETATMTIMATKSLTLSIIPSVTLESSDSSTFPSLFITEYSRILPTTATITPTAVAISLSSIEYSISPSATLSSVIMSSVSVSELVNETELFIKASSIVIGSRAITELQSATVRTSTKNLKSTVKQTTTEPSNAIQSTLLMTRSLNATVLPTSSETLLPISTEQLTPAISKTIVSTADSTRLEEESPTTSSLLATSTGSLNDSIIPSTISVEYSNIGLLRTSEFSSLLYSNFHLTTGHSEPRTVTSTVAESTPPKPTVHPSLALSNSKIQTITSAVETTSLSISKFSITESTSQQILPTPLISSITPSTKGESVTVRNVMQTSVVSATDKLAISELSVTTLRSVTDLESKDTILIQVAVTTSSSPRFITVASSSTLPLQITTKTISNSPKHSATSISVTTTVMSTQAFPATSKLLVATESDIETTVTTSESPASLEATIVPITATKHATTETSPLPLLETPITITGPLVTTTHSSTIEYSSQTSESPLTVDITSMATMIMPSRSMGSYVTIETSISPLLEIPTIITEPLVTIGHSSTMEYLSQRPELSVSVKITSRLITTTKFLSITPSMSMGSYTTTETSISPHSETPTITGSLATIGYSSTMEYLPQISETPVSVEITSMTAMIMPSRIMGSYAITETSISLLSETPTTTGPLGYSNTKAYSSQRSESPVSVEITSTTTVVTPSRSINTDILISPTLETSTIGHSNTMENSPQISQSLVSVEITNIATMIMPSRSITAETLISPILETPTITGSLTTIGNSSTMEYLPQISESPVSVEITSTATMIMPSRSTGSYISSISPLLETPTITGSLGYSSTEEYSSQSSDTLITSITPVLTARESSTITESLITIGYSSATEYSTQILNSLGVSKSVNVLTTIAPQAMSISDVVKSSAVTKITNSVKSRPPQTKTSTTTESQSPSITLSPTPDVPKCRQQEIPSKEGITFVWPETPVHHNATIKCPKNFAFELHRKCTVGGQWEDFDETECGVLAKNFTSLVMESENLTNSTLEKTVDTLVKLVEESLKNPVEQSIENMNGISNTLINLANHVNMSKTSINKTAIGNIVKTLDSLFQWTPSTILTNTSSRIVESFERVMSQYAQQIPPNVKENFTNPSVSIMAENMPAEILQQKGRNVAFGNGGQVMEADNMPGQLSSQQQAAISLPASLFKRITMTDVGMFFGLYENATLFPVGGASTDSSVLRQPQVCSNILAATVGQNIESDLRDLSPDESVTLTFRREDKLPGVFIAPKSEKCVSWDFNTQDWTERGCNVTNNTKDGVLVCHCNHLTNFAILVDICQTQDCQTSTTMTPTTFPTTQPAEMQLNLLNNSFTNLTNDTYGEAVMMLADIVEGTEDSTANQNGQVLKQVADYFSALATFVNGSNVIINKTVVNDVVQVVSSLIQWEPGNVMVESSSSVVESFEKVIALYAQQLPLNKSINLTLPSLTLVAESRSVESLALEGRSFTIGNNQATPGPEEHVMHGQLHPTQDAAVRLPASLFQQIDNHTKIGIFFAVYDTPTLFPVNRESNIHSDVADVGSPVLSITVGPRLNFRELEHNITIVLRLIPKNFTVPGTERCVSWDFNRQDWTTQGCTTHIGQDGIVSCSCNHLTNFAVLVDICLRQEDCQPSKVDTALTFISYIGMSISIVFLAITIITLFLFKEVRQKDISKYHIQLSLAILLMLVVSLVLVATSAGDITTVYGGCMTVSVLVHYFTLVSVMWMGAEALLMLQKLVYVFYKITTKFIISVSIVCWTVPSILVAIPLTVDLATGYNIESDIIVKRANKSGDMSYCFLSHIGAFWGAFLGPIIIIMLLNIFIFIRVIIVMVRHTKDTAARLKKPVSRKTIIRLMISIGGVMFLFGLTWLFAILTFSVTGLRETFQILFVVFNSFQGLFIFLFVCVLNKEVLESWKEFLSCGMYQSKLLHPTPARIVAVRKYQTNTNSTGFGSSSAGGKNNSETLKSSYDSSTLSIQNIHQPARASNLSIENMQKPARASKPDRLPTKTALSDGATALATTNTITANQNKRDSDGEEATKNQARKKNVVKIEVVEQVGNEGALEEESSDNTTKKHAVRIEVVEEV